MSHNSRNSHINININQYTTLADEVEVDKLSVHTISANSNSISTEEALADEAEQQQLKIELFEDNIREISSALSNFSYFKTESVKDKEVHFDKDKDMNQ